MSQKIVHSRINALLALSIAGITSGCGTHVPTHAEFWDKSDPDATLHMEMQVKRAIYCELRQGAREAKKKILRRFFQGKEVTTEADEFLPDTWGAQITLNFTVDETSKFAPGVSFNTPMHSGVTNFIGETIGATPLVAAMTYGPVTTAQSYAFGLGGTLSSQATRIDKHSFFYTVGDLRRDFGGKDACDESQSGAFGPKSTSSPFLVISEIGLRKWLSDAAALNDSLRSTRAALNGIGPATGSVGSFNSDSVSFEAKFIVTSSVNATPIWKLVRISANTGASFFDTSRVRTHDILVTLGESKVEVVKIGTGKQRSIVSTGPGAAAANSHLASQIGLAVGSQIRPAQ